MPSLAFDYGRNDSKRLAAWVSHYKAKGCSERKAWQLAHAKRCKRNSWPLAAA